MTDQSKTDTQAEHKKLVEKGKALGIKQAVNMKPENLIKRIAEIESKQEQEPKQERSGLKIEVSREGKDFLKEIRFPYTKLERWASELLYEKLVYNSTARCFECYRNKQHVDNISINSF